MTSKFKYLVYLVLLTGTMACKKPYYPAVISTSNSYLVVEGVINPGADSTIIALSKTVKVTDKNSLVPETGAKVTVEDEDNVAVALQEIGFSSGRYAISALNLNSTKKYRLHIETGDSKVYNSDFVAVKPNPPVDSVSYKIAGNGLQIFSNTHDPNNTTRYYRWAYEETWRFHAAYNTSLISRDTGVSVRNADEYYYYCFAGDRSSNIVIASSAKLKQDVIFENPIITIAPNSEKLTIRYSILLKQYALTKPEYEFWENIKKNTEQLGSIFDAQPSQLVGNIHCTTNAAEPVIGYVGITNVQLKRIFISNKALPSSWGPGSDANCSIDSAYFKNPLTGNNDVLTNILHGSFVPISTIAHDGFHVIGYTASSVYCTDCRVRGVLQTPSFWIN